MDGYSLDAQRDKLRKQHIEIDFTNCQMIPLTQNAASAISQWEYEKPYDAYNFKAHSNGYLVSLMEQIYGSAGQ